MLPPTPPDFIRVGTLKELKQKQCIVVPGHDHPLAVFYNDGRIKAVDNRCPHMGFPLSKGSVHDGILTCHWHHARFDLASGCTFDLFADDVPPARVEVRDGEVFVAPRTHIADHRAHWRRRLHEGLAQDIGLIIAKSVIAQLRQGVNFRDIVKDAALFGAAQRDGWASGMTIMTAMANVFPLLGQDDRFIALYHGLTRVADDCAGEVPRRQRHPLDESDVPPDTLKRWLRDWTRVRHRDGAERTLLTAIGHAMPLPDLAQMMLVAATDRFFADGGHSVDFLNKSFELLDLIGPENARHILPTVVRQLVSARGGEESSAWRHPIDLVAMLHQAFDRLPAWLGQGRETSGWNSTPHLAHQLLGDNPSDVVAALASAIQAGAAPTQLTSALCLAAATRIARFGTANEFGDWITALHTFTYCNSLHQLMTRLRATGIENPLVLRGIFHGAIAVYLDRFLNVPPAALPGERRPIDQTPADPQQLLTQYLDVLNTQQRVNAAADVVARYLNQNHPIDPLIATLARGVLREDADFHTFQMLEAAVRQFHEWGNCAEGRIILIALARYSAAHSPTQRAQYQTADIALRLDRSEPLFEEE